MRGNQVLQCARKVNVSEFQIACHNVVFKQSNFDTRCILAILILQEGFTTFDDSSHFNK